MPRSYVGNSVTWSIGTIKIAQAEDGEIRYDRDLQVSEPLGQEEKIIRPGGRLVHWKVNGNQVNITSWAFAIGAPDITQVGNTSLTTLENYEQNGGSVETIVKRLFTYDVPINWEMIDAETKKAMYWTLKGAKVGSISVRTTKRGFVKMYLEGLAVGIKTVDEIISDEDLNQWNLGV